MLLTNPVVISVVVMILLCLFNLNIILALLVAALVAGLTAGMGFTQTMGVMIGGMGGNAEMALSYVLLGSLAVAINQTNLATVACNRIAAMVKGRKIFLIFLMAFVACLSGTIIPVHIAFIPILIPPLLYLFNQLHTDRRQVACALAYGLKAPYVTIPIGYGIIFHGLLATQMTLNGVPMEAENVWRFNWPLGIGMTVGLIIAVFVSYVRPRDYEDKPVIGIDGHNSQDMAFNRTHLFTAIAIVAAFAAQLMTSSLPLGALAALGIMIATGSLKWKRIDEALAGGIGIMGLIAFIMLVAAGFGAVIRETKAVELLVKELVGAVGGSQMWGAFLMLLVGLLVTMGIGTSFGTIPVVAAIYCPLSIELGFSPGATLCLLAAAAALGDAGSPASDTTLGPTAGLNADGQHNHIWDTCVPTFLHYNIPLIISAMIGAIVLF